MNSMLITRWMPYVRQQLDCILKVLFCTVTVLINQFKVVVVMLPFLQLCDITTWPTFLRDETFADVW